MDPLRLTLGIRGEVHTDESSQVSTVLSSVTGSTFNPGRSVDGSAHGFAIDHDITNALPPTAIFGRNQEVAILQKAFSQLTKVGNHAVASGNERTNKGGGKKWSHTTEVVVIHGPSGCGKTKLVDAALRNYVIANNGNFVSGKFDQTKMIGESFSALASALSDLCELLISSLQKEEIESLRRSLRNSLGNEAITLTRLIPTLSYILPETKVPLGGVSSTEEAEGGSSARGGGGAAFTRLQQLCCSFLHIVATSEKPLALFVDDVQWADEASLQIIRTLATHPQTRHVLVVAAFRDDEVAESDTTRKDHLSVHDFVERIQKEEVDSHVVVNSTVLQLENLDRDSLNEMLSAMLDADEDATKELSELILRKTHGNPFFVEQYLDMLQQEGLLETTAGGGFSWDVSKIRSETDVSANVAELVSKKIMVLGEPVQEVLKVASMLGYRFQYIMLRRVVTAVLSPDLMATQSGSGEWSLQSILQSAVDAGLLETDVSFKFKFSHDRIQQCLLGMIASEEIDLLHLRIGRALRELGAEQERKRHGKHVPGSMSRLSPDDLSALWAATDHLNLGSTKMTDQTEKLDLARLNVQAGKRTLQQCDFRSAIGYTERALSLLDELSDQKWIDHYESTLATTSLLCYLQFCVGDEAKCNLYAQEVSDNARCLHDKLDAYSTQIRSVSWQEHRFGQGMQLGLSVLDMIGEGLPHKVRFWHIGKELMAARKAFRLIDHDTVMTLAPMVDKNKLAAVKLMQTMMFGVYLSESYRSHFALIVLRLTNLTLQYGSTLWTPAIISQYGGLEAVIGNLKMGRQMLSLSTKLIEQSESKEAQARALAMQHGLLSQWFQGYPEAIDGFGRSHRLGMESGEFEFALHSASQYTSLASFSTIPLAEIEQDTRIICQQMKEFNMENLLICALPMWQGMLNMMGEADGDPAKLTGEAMDEDQFVAKVEGGTNRLASMVLLLMRLGAATAFNRWQLMEDLLAELTPTRKLVLKGHFSNFYATFSESIAALRLYGRNGSRKYRRRGRITVKRLEAWSRMGVVDCDALALGMRADLMMVTSRRKGKQFNKALDLFHQAIESSKKIGSTQLEAHYNERLFELLSRIEEEPDQALPYLQRSVELFENWGAVGKSNFLKVAYVSNI